MQRKMTGNPIAAGAVPRDHHHQQQLNRRVLMQQQQQGQGPSPPPPPYGANPMQQHHQQQSPPSYLGMNVNMGLTMTMSDMTSSIRSFPPMLPQHQQHQHQQQQQQQLGPSTSASPSTHDGNSFWRTSGMDPAAASAYAKHSGGLELELGDILGGSSNSSNSNMDDAERDGNPEGGDVTMSVMNSSFEVSPFGDHMNIGSGAVGTMKPGYHMSTSQPHPALLRQQQQQQQQQQQHLAVRGGGGGVAASVAGSISQDAGRPGRSDSNASSVGVGGGDGSASESSEYSRFVDSRDAPDLSQQKIDEKNEKCQFHNCPNRARVSQAYGKFCNRHVIVAPCGFPGCRDKAMLNSSMCEKHLQEGKDALHKILASRAQNVPVCRTFGCFKNDQGRGYCRGHEKLLMATGRLPKHINKRRLNSAYTMCSYPGCNKHSQRNHLCRTHGNLITKQAEELCSRSSGETFEEILARLQKDVRKCTNPTCTKNSQRDRLCTMHYYEKNNLPRDGAASAGAGAGTEQPSEASSDTVVVCSMTDCNLQAVAKGMCKYHSGQGQKSPGAVSDNTASGIREVERTRCNVQGCAQMSYTSGICLQHFKQQQQQQQHSAHGGRYNNAISPFGDDRFNAPIDPTNPPRSNMESFYSGVGGSAYGSSMDPSMSGYSGVGGAGRHLPGGAGTGGASSDVENEAKQALFTLNGKPTDPVRAYNTHDGSVSRSVSSCTNPICNREAYGREYCDSCQSIFSPLVVSVGDSLGGGTSYPYSSNAQPEPESSPQGWGGAASQAKPSSGKGSDTCRMSQCNNPRGPNGGLCETHFRSFEVGAISVDALTLRSVQIKQQTEQQQASAPATGNSGGKSPTGGGKLKKYFCKTEGCDKQAQRKGLCKRHFRLQEEGSSQNASGEPTSEFVSQNQTSAGANQSSATSCRFSGCVQVVDGNSTLLCPLHANASFCRQPGCENIVNGPQFCEFHSYRKQCAYEGCTYPANRDASGCSNHAMERRCSHAHCDKFTVGTTGDRCRLHQISCKEEPCAICELHGLYSATGFSTSSRRPGAQQSGGGARSRRANSENIRGGGNSGFSQAKANSSAPSYHDPRLL